MNQNKIIAITAVVILLGAGAFFLSQNSSPSTSGTNSEAMMEKDADLGDDDAMMEGDDKMEKNDTMMADGGTYVEHSPGVVESASNTRRVLFFYANWCPTCQPSDADFRNNEADIPSDVTVIRVNYNDDDTDDAEEALANKYNVSYQHTFVQIDSNGNEVTTWNGGDLSDLLSRIQ